MSETEVLVKSRYPLVYLVSPEEQRVETSLLEFAKNRKMAIYRWSITEGLVDMKEQRSVDGTKDPLKVLEFISKFDSKAIFVMRDFHPYMDGKENPVVVRKLRDLASDLRFSQKTVLFLSSVSKVPTELEKEISVVDWDLPNREEINAIVEEFLTRLPTGVSPGIAETQQGREQIVEAALGLTKIEIENVLAKSIVRNKTFDVPTILGEKKQIIRKSGILEYYEAEESLEDIGGLETLKHWLKKRRGAFTSRARDFGLPLPKGILLIGVPGCGKSLTAKAVGAAWQMPLLRLDVGKIFGGLVGSSEENIRKVIKTAEAIAPAVLWLDELEKGFSGTGSSNMSDGGTTSRVFGTFVTWLQEKRSPVFVIATANDVRSLPPELLRKGRFDEIFFVDLPSKEERKSIFEIHLRKKRRDPSTIQMEKVLDLAAEFSGSEVEQAVVSALYDAFDAETDVTTEGLLHAVKEIVPLAVTMKENIDAMREWAKTRARTASSRKSSEQKIRRILGD